MAKRNRAALAAAANESSTPPSVLNPSQSVARVVGAEGSSVYTVALPSAKTVPVELAPLFRNTIWLKRGGYVLVDLASMADRQKSGSRIVGEIVNVVRDEKAWRKMAYWPKQFPRRVDVEDEDEDESNVGKMPPDESEAEGEEHGSDEQEQATES
ncbi:hypothetical protein P8C59_000986 [Phyllachora maydis]|uniref:S1-like domain-containing protein n=1 Tax=Phyllachora maydis TaxID=1825666 RepID=A0AAD9HXG8_9PEZI|nr:hypothetical protein P8C59_000986 [Phyllachora maydis]